MRNSSDSEFLKFPPQQIEAEQSLLGALMVDNSGIDDCLELLCGDEFYRDSHRKIYAGIKALHTGQQPIDIITLSEFLSGKKQLESAGGSTYLASLLETVSSAANVTSYAKIVKEKSTLRRLIQATTEIQSFCYDGGKPISKLLDDAESSIFAITQNGAGNETLSCTITESLKEFVVATEHRVENRHHVMGIPTGFPELDRYISGWCNEEYIIVASRPSVGKTAFATAIARRVAKRGIKVAFFSAEMGKQITPRMVAQESHLNLTKVRTGQLTKEELVRFITVSGELGQLPIEIFYSSSPTELEIKQQVRRTKPGMVIVDYIGYCRCSEGSDSVMKRERQISAISSCFKSIARDCKIPVMALSQLNREIEKMNRPPKLSDLRESGSLEQDGDIVIFLHSDSKEDGWRDVIIEKNRNGPCGKVRLAFLNQSTEFEKLAQFD